MGPHFLPLYLHESTLIANICSIRQNQTTSLGAFMKVRKGAKIRNRYNQAPHLTQDTNGKSATSHQDITHESQVVSPFPAGDHKASKNRRTRKHNKNKRHIKGLTFTQVSINLTPGLEIIKLVSCSTQLSTKFQLLIKIKIPTNKEISCLKSLRRCIYHADKC